MKKELSGLFLSEERFQASLDELRTSEACTHIRLFHNTGQQVKHLVSALAAGASGVVHVEIGELDTEGAEALEAFFNSPHPISRPTSLHIQHVTDVVAARALGRGLTAPGCPVRELCLQSMSQPQLAEVLDPLAGNPDAAGRMRTLQLLQCQVGPVAAAAIGAMAQLVQLEASMDDAATTIALAPYATSSGGTPATPPQLQTLKLRSSPMSQKGLSVVSAAIRNLRLMHVSLAGINIGEQAAAQFADALAHNTTLCHLDLTSCHLGPAAGGPLGAAAANGSLKTLLLDDNDLGAQGVGALLASLATCPRDSLKLGRLHLGRNHVRGADLPPGTADLRIAAPLSWLSLERNQLLDAGAAALLPALTAAGALEHVDLRENGIGEPGAAHVVALLKASPQLRELILDGNRLHDGGAEAVLAAGLAHTALRALRMDACRVTNPLLKGKIAEVCLALSARHRASTDSAGCGSTRSSLDIAASRQRRIGTRFPPEVYHVQQGPAVSQPVDVVQSPGSGRVRMGSRFPPEIYMRPVAEDEPQGAGGGSQHMEGLPATHKHVRDAAGDGDGAATLHSRRRFSCDAGPHNAGMGSGGVPRSSVDGNAQIRGPFGAHATQLALQQSAQGCLSISPQGSLSLSPQSSLANSPSVGGWVRPGCEGAQANRLLVTCASGSSAGTCSRRFKPLTAEQQRQFVDF